MSQSRLELLTTRLSGVHSNQLSYWLLKSASLRALARTRAKGAKLKALKNLWFYLNKITLGKTRTFNPQIRSLILYPIEPRARILVYAPLTSD